MPYQINYVTNWGTEICDGYRFGGLRWAGFSAQMLMRSTKLSVTTKLSAENETPIANVLLAVVYLYAIAALDGPANGIREVDLKPTLFAHLLKSAKV